MYTTEQVVKMLEQAATEGLRVGKEGTEGDHTAAGIAMTVFLANPVDKRPTTR